jgi:PAS domain S-box-containing protein
VSADPDLIVEPGPGRVDGGGSHSVSPERSMTLLLPRPMIACAAYALLHMGLQFSSQVFEVAPGLSVWYAPAGLTLGLLILLGPRSAFLVFAVNALGALSTHDSGSPWAPLLFPLLITLYYTGVAGWIRRCHGSRLLPGSFRQTRAFVLTLLLAPFGMALVGTGTSILTGLSPTHGFARAAALWWIGDMSGLLTVIPALMVFVAPWLSSHRASDQALIARAGITTRLFVLACLLLLTSLTAVFLLDPSFRFQALSLCFLPLIWICLRHGLPGATLAILLVTMAGLAGLPLTPGTHEQVIGFLFFVLTFAGVGLGLGSAVSRRSLAEAELASNQARLDRVVSGARLGLWDWDVPGDRVAYNLRCAELLGTPLAPLEPTRQAWDDAIHPEDRAHVAAALEAHLEGRSACFETDYRIQSGDQRVRWIHTRGSIVERDEHQRPLLVSGTHLDVTHQKQIEAENLQNERQLMQVQKTESLGVLAGGVAHDFNNLLTAILGNAQLAKLDVPAPSPPHDALGQIEIAATRAARLCQQMMAYAGRSPLSPADLDLNTLISDTQPLIEATVGKKVHVEYKLSRPLPLTRGEPNQLQQVVMNLVINASEAMGNQTGRIEVRTAILALDSERLTSLFQAPALPGGNYVLLEVSDTGVGIAPDLLPRIFEPFFTTKVAGPGLGLAAVLGIVKSHGGALRVTSEPGHGSTFQLVFPVIRTAARSELRPVLPAPDYTWTGSGTILVVDDEEPVRNVIAGMVRSLGFTPLPATDGLEGVELFRRHSGRLRAVVLDLAMPRMDGAEALRAMQTIDARVPVLLMSGFSNKLTLDQFAQARPSGLLAKPFTRLALQQQLQSALAACPLRA